jgi:pyrroline-5-carboxylate reductase
MTDRTLGFIGGGRITRIILEGFRKKGLDFREVVVSDMDQGALSRLRERYPAVRTSPGDNRAPAGCDLVFLALHPPACSAALDEITGTLKPGAVLVSLAPKITIARISERLGGFSRIARMIPNAPSIIGAGYNPIALSPALDPRDKERLNGLFKALGECPEVPEKDLEAYAILAAMGPTYFWFQWEELENLGAGFGLTREEARKTLSAMISGAAQTYFHSGLTGGEVVDLIPVKPLKDDEEDIRSRYRLRLGPLYDKIKP